MIRRAAIVLFFLTYACTWSASGTTASLFYHAPAEIHPTKTDDRPAAYPGSQPYIFAIQHQAESGVNLRLNLTSITDSPVDSNGANSLVQKRTHCFSLYYADNYRGWIQGLLIKKLLFPFHSFL